MERVKIKVRYYRDIEKLKKISIGDWIDLRAGETVVMKKGDLKLIPLGIGMKLPDGYEAVIVPRSSTPKRNHIVCANSMGVIDNTYCGEGDEWGFPAYAIETTVVYKNERICQFRIQKNQPEIEFEEVEKLDDKPRGGFGSTGSR